MINRAQTIKSAPICKNCQHKERADDCKVAPLSKKEWVCLRVKIIDPLDGEVSYHFCHKSRRDEKLCGPQGQWFKAKP